LSQALRTLALIPARGGSKRAPGKNLRPLAGKPLVARALEAALGARRPARVVVSSDDDEVLSIAAGYGSATAHPRPSALATDKSLVLETVKYVLDDLENKRGEPRFDAVVIVQPSSPFTESGDIDGVLELLERTGAESAVSVSEVDFTFHPVKLKVFEGDRLLPFLEDERGRMAVHELPRLFARNGSVYATRRTVLDTGRILGDDCRGYVMPRERSVDVNDELDWAFAEFLAGRNELAGRS
jgi:CMP-N,N'-diacetyllegionaminic acid synthase